MIRILLIVFFVLNLSSGVAFQADLYPSLDLEIPTPLPKCFRIPTQPFVIESARVPSRVGLDKIRASASGQFSESDLALMLMKLPTNKKILVVDLREESHGFINGLPVSWRLPHTTWTNVQKSLVQIEENERELCQQVAKLNKVIIDPQNKPLPIQVSRAYTEKELIKRYNLDYLRIPITENHKPSDAAVEQIMQLIQNQPEGLWLHIHCHGGRGRTTTFLLMYDMLKNGRQVSLDDIFLRHLLLGGTDLKKQLDLKIPRHVALYYRLQFLKQFYEYVTTNDINKVSWTTWSKAHPVKPPH